MIRLAHYDPSQEAVRLYDEGVHLFSMGREEEARALWEEVIEKYPSHPLSFFLKASFHVDRGEDDRAVLEYTKGLEVEPLDGTARCSLGKIYLRKNLPDEAIREFEQALAILPQNSSFCWWTAAAYHKKGDLETAYDYLLKSARFNPDDPQLLRDLGFLCAEMGRRAEAAEHFNSYARMCPGAPDIDEIARWMTS